MPDNSLDFLSQNMVLLKKNYPHVWGILTQTPPKPVGKIFPAPNGRPNLWAHDQEGNQLSLHIPEDPQLEVGQFLAMVDKDFSGVLTITGMGLGYAPLALIQHRRNLRHLAVFEPNAGIFLQALHAMDLSPLLADPRVILGIGPEQNVGAVMGPANKALQLESIQNLQHLPSFSLNFPEYKQLHQAVCDHCSSFNIEGNTLNFMGREFLENRLRHLNSMHHNRFLAELAGRFKKVPAIIVSAGPSLDKNIHLLAQAKGKAVILAADSALPALAAHKIMPDLVGTIDPLELIFEKVAGVAPAVHGVSLLCMSWASSKMAKLFPADQIFWGFGAKPIEAWMSHLFGQQLLTAGAGSVAHLNLISAIIMECSPIIFIGQDLSFSPTKSHSANAVLQTNDLVEALLANQEDIVWLDGIDGGQVLSNRGMHSHKLFFERVIKDQKGHYINATEGGCHIEGTEVMSLQQAINQYCAEDIAIAETLAPTTTPDKTPLTKHLLNAFRKITKEGATLAKKIDKADQLSHHILQWLKKEEKRKARYRAFEALPLPIQKKIAELDTINKQLDGAHAIWPLLQEVTMAGLRHSEQQKHTIEMMANDPQRYTEWLAKNIHRFLQINTVRREVLPLLTNQLSADITFLQDEERLLEALNKQQEQDGESRTENMLALARLYFETDNLNLARPWVEELHQRLPESAEVNFLLGWIAAHYTEYKRAEALFKKATKANPDYIERIALFRQKQGDAYIKYAAHFANNDKNTSRRLLAKGLLYAPEHPGLKQRLIALCDQALSEIKKREAETNFDKINAISDSWLADLAANNHLASVIGPERTAQFHRACGVFLADKKDYPQAAAAFGNALRLTPDDSALHISITDMYFAMEQYPQGIAHLDKAVSLDSAYVIYWEDIGDSLAESGQHEDALAAYERCFTILPERIHLLKKIGDCYMASGKLNAAREAYLQLKIQMQAIEAMPHIVQ